METENITFTVSPEAYTSFTASSPTLCRETLADEVKAHVKKLVETTGIGYCSDNGGPCAILSGLKLDMDTALHTMLRTLHYTDNTVLLHKVEAEQQRIWVGIDDAVDAFKKSVGRTSSVIDSLLDIGATK